MSSPGPSLPARYRSLSQVMAVVASMGILTLSTRPTIPSLGMSTSTPLMTSLFVTSVPVRPIFCMAPSMPTITTQSARASSVPKDVYIASAIPENISLEEYRLSLQPSNSEVGQSSQDLNCPYFSCYGPDGTSIYVFPYQYDEQGNPLRFPAPEAYQYINSFLSAQAGQPYNPQGQPFQGQPSAQPGYLYDPQRQPLQGQPLGQ